MLNTKKLLLNIETSPAPGTDAAYVTDLIKTRSDIASHMARGASVDDLLKMAQTLESIDRLLSAE